MIPPHAHLIWLGSQLSPFAYFAVRSALDRGGFEDVTLHYDDPALLSDPLVRDLAGRPSVSFSRLDLDTLAAEDAAHADPLPPAVWDRLRALDRALLAPVRRANLFRLALVWLYGGVYLDVDLVVLRDFAPLRAYPGFAGFERMTYPLRVVRSRNPLLWARSLLLDGARAAVCAFAPSPPRLFERIERLYTLGTNNAVFGAHPRHPMLRRLLEVATSKGDREALRHGRLGFLLFQEVTGNRSHPGFAVFDPAAFYPFAPEVSITYFRDDPEGHFGCVPHADAFAAHLYDNVIRKGRLGGPFDAARLRRTRGRTLFTRMVEPYLDDFFAVMNDWFYRSK